MSVTPPTITVYNDGSNSCIIATNYSYYPLLTIYIPVPAGKSATYSNKGGDIQTVTEVPVEAQPYGIDAYRYTLTTQAAYSYDFTYSDITTVRVIDNTNGIDSVLTPNFGTTVPQPNNGDGYDPNIYERSTDDLWPGSTPPIVVKRSIIVDADILNNNGIFFSGTQITTCTNRGTYSNSVVYVLGDIVLYNSKSYLAIIAADPRGEAFSGLYNVPPTTFTSVWYELPPPPPPPSSGPRAGQSSIFGQATATKLIYTPLVSVDLVNNAINLVDAQAYGHRVKLEVPVADLNGCFSWSRASGDLYPVGACDSDAVKTVIDTQIPAVGFVDLDSQADGLNFSSSALDSATDPRLRASGDESANDLVMAYVLYRLYGKSSYETLDNIFNLEDAQGMLADATLSTAIKDSLLATDGVASIKKMFRDLVSSDPQRFFDASGKQVSGIFETNTDSTGTGLWNLTPGDIIEIRVEFHFGSAITRRDGADNQIETVGTAQNTTNVPADTKFNIRLQMTAV